MGKAKEIADKVKPSLLKRSKKKPSKSTNLPLLKLAHEPETSTATAESSVTLPL